MKRKLGWFVGGSILLWLATALPAYALWGDQALLLSSVAYGICLLPMIATMVWIELSVGGVPEDQLAAVLGGTGIRMFVVILGAILLHRNVAALDYAEFLYAVVFYYLATLALEIGILVGLKQPPPV